MKKKQVYTGRYNGRYNRIVKGTNTELALDMLCEDGLTIVNDSPIQTMAMRAVSPSFPSFHTTIPSCVASLTVHLALPRALKPKTTSNQGAHCE